MPSLQLPLMHQQPKEPGSDGSVMIGSQLPRHSSVHNLQQLYTVAVGVAVAVAIAQIMDATTRLEPRLAWWRIPALVAFLATIIPFYHGAMRHLEHTYVERDGRDVREGSLLADFIILFIQACLFFVFARTLVDAHAAAVGLLVVLAVDVVWGVAVALLLRKNRRAELAAMRWVPINVVTVVVLSIAIALDRSPPVAGHVDAVGYVLMTVAILRSTVDYAASWRFYFP
jgi:hypothetical protein